MNDRLNIVMVSDHACIRVQKMALPLLERGHAVHLIARKIPSFVENYETVTMWNDIRQLIEAVRLHKDADLFHCHNEPSFFVTICKENSDAPVILDVHDSYLNRTTPAQAREAREKGENPVRETVEERTNFQLADGLVFVSETMRRDISGEFGLYQPSLVLPSYVPRRFYRYAFKQWLGGLVYEGKVMLPEEIKAHKQAAGFEYCDYLPLAHECQRLGIDFNLYPARNDKPFMDAYDKIAFVHPPVNFMGLLDNITRHDWGLVGNTINSPQWQIALPNKLFEYVAAGIPPVVINAREAAEFVRQEGIGIVVESMEELGWRWKEHRECRDRLIRRRQAFSMDAHIHNLEGFYKEIMDA